MSVNTMDFVQAAAILNDIQKQATGRETIAPTNTAEFVSVGTTLLSMGYEPVLNAITQVLSKTIFSTRPYSRKFQGLEVTSSKYGAIFRKLQIADKGFEVNPEFNLVDGESIDHYKVSKPDVVQTNFYGQMTYSIKYTIFKDQLDSAFEGPEQFSQFMTMIVTNISDQIEQAHENLARATIANMIGGKIAANNGVIHLLREYNAVSGENLTKQSIYAPGNEHFWQWVFSRIDTISSRMTNRSTEYQILIQDKPVMHHTPREMQKVLLYNPAKQLIEKTVLTDAYHDNYLKFADNEGVDYWQALDDPEKINVTPAYLGPDGNIVTGEAQEIDNILGVIFDEEMMGYTVVNQWAATTPLNIDGGYWNTRYHFTDKYWNDYSEKAVVLLLD